MINKKGVAVGAGVGATFLAGAASAAVDTTAAVSQFADVGTGAEAIGVAMLTAAIAGIVYKWLVAFVL